jgi:anti-sigma regulatory factor (Ser/Thr protein kinase)
MTYPAPHEPLLLESEATAHRLAEVRRLLATWLRAAEVSDEVVGDVVLAVNEACTNCAEHAYRNGRPGSMRVEAAVGAAEITVEVTDWGSWRTPPDDPGARGRGLLVIRALSEVVKIVGASTGTTVALQFRVLPCGAHPALSPAPSR